MTYKSSKILHIFMSLLMIWVAVTSAHHLSGLQLAQLNQTVTVSAAQCPVQQASSVGQLCSENVSSFTAILIDYFSAFQLLSGVAAFLFIVALSSESPIYRIYKPPKN